jgi:hypothetical protein
VVRSPTRLLLRRRCGASENQITSTPSPVTPTTVASGCCSPEATARMARETAARRNPSLRVRLAARAAYEARMFTAREMIRPRVTSETSPSMLISALAVRELGMASVGLKAVAVVMASAR